MPVENIELILRGFLVVVSDMRSAQKSYFKSRDKKDLTRSIELEKQIDKFISEFNISEKQKPNHDNSKT
jgi:hypothetical protein